MKKILSGMLVAIFAITGVIILNSSVSAVNALNIDELADGGESVPDSGITWNSVENAASYNIYLTYMSVGADNIPEGYIRTGVTTEPGADLARNLNNICMTLADNPDAAGCNANGVGYYLLTIAALDDSNNTIYHTDTFVVGKFNDGSIRLERSNEGIYEVEDNVIDYTLETNGAIDDESVALFKSLNSIYYNQTLWVPTKEDIDGIEEVNFKDGYAFDALLVNGKRIEAGTPFIIFNDGSDVTIEMLWTEEAESTKNPNTVDVMPFILSSLGISLVAGLYVTAKKATRR